MKLLARMKQNYTFDQWGPVVQNDANGTIVYVYQRSTKGNFVSGRNQSYLFTVQQIPVGVMLRNVKDADGTYVFAVLGEPYDVYVHSSEPVLDVYGQVTGYRQVVRRHQPNLTAGSVHF